MSDAQGTVEEMTDDEFFDGFEDLFAEAAKKAQQAIDVEKLKQSTDPQPAKFDVDAIVNGTAGFPDSDKSLDW